ncbi:MAG: hypothetical protein U5K29_11600 [Acidimicrobiales bacterium]|nr:hypothetical protein [Acidimicrobiales bacterium]
MNRWGPRALAAVLVAAMVAPAVIDPPRDGFPLSTYPMFAFDRGSVTSVTTAVGVTDAGGRVRLSPYLLAGADEAILAVRTARIAVAEEDTDRWCEEVASRVAASSGASVSSERVVAIEVVTETHDASATLAGSAEPLRIVLHTTCPVEPR